MKKRYFYRCKVESGLGKDLADFVARCQQASSVADDYVKNIGAKEYVESPLGMAGGVACIFDVPEEGREGVWRTIEFADGSIAYIPDVPDDFSIADVRGRDITTIPLSQAEKMEIERLSLPIVPVSELASILGVDTSCRVHVSETPVFFRYTPDPGVTYPKPERWYISTSFPCSNPGLEDVDSREFYKRRLAALNRS